MNKQLRRYSREEKLTGKRVVQTPLQYLFFVVVMSIFWGESLEASQTRTWSVSGSAAQTSTGGGVTTVSVSAPGVQGSSSGWEIRGNNNVNAPNASSYSPNVIGDAGLELLFVPNGTNSRQITFTFSNPVTDPVLHMDRLGGQSSGITNSSAWTLNTTASNGATALQSVSGVDHFRVDAGNTRLVGSFNQTANSGWGGECRTSFQSGSACGSVRVLGTFTTLVFDVRMQGNVGAGDAVELLFTLNQDLGDAPSGYGRAMHAIGQNVNRYLGSVAPDDDPNGNEFSVLADNDDINGADDEDVINAATFVKGQTVSLPLPVVEPTTGSSFLNAWVDWNRNGVFENSERIASDAINNGAGDQDGNPATLTIDVSVPANAVSGETFSRFRWSTQSGLGATGATTGGEVEDHQVNVTMQPLSCDVGVSDSLQLSGSASRDVSTREITLTTDVGNQAGTAWSQNRISLLSAFSVEFSVYLGTKNAAGADAVSYTHLTLPTIYSV